MEMDMRVLTEIRKATLSARARTGDKAIGTTVSAGRFQVRRVTYSKNGCSTVEPISDFLPFADCIHFLNSLEALPGAAS